MTADQVLRALVDYIDRKMDDGERPCPLCGHHYIHTNLDNVGRADREYESVCPYVLAQLVLETIRKEQD